MIIYASFPSLGTTSHFVTTIPLPDLVPLTLPDDYCLRQSHYSASGYEISRPSDSYAIPPETLIRNGGRYFVSDGRIDPQTGLFFPRRELFRAVP